MPTISVPWFMGERLEGFAVPDPDVLIDPPLPEAGPTERMGILNRHLADAIAADEAPVVWAGDCVAICGGLAGLQRRGIDPVLVFFDAHGDFHTWETSQSGFIGGMPLAMVVGRGEQTVVAGAGAAVIPEADAVLVDGRDLDPGEDEAVAGSKLTLLRAGDVPSWEPPDRPLYVHVDVDVVDPADMPAVNYPAPGGPSLADVEAALAALARTGRVAAVSFSCWNPALPGAERAAAATARLAAALT